jgi:hypothetical protein
MAHSCDRRGRDSQLVITVVLISGGPEFAR